MKVKMFTRKQNFWRAAIVTEPLEQDINDWLTANGGIQVIEVKHDVSGSVWTYTQLTVSIYYREG